jgi:hypothetical protein
VSATSSPTTDPDATGSGQQTTRKLYPDYNAAYAMADQVLIAHGYVDSKGDPFWDALREKIVEIALSLPDSNGSKHHPDGALGAILVKVLSSLKVDNFSTLEEEAVYDIFYQKVNSVCTASATGPIQRALGEEGKGRFVCRGKIVLKGNRVAGIWISTTVKVTGPVSGQYDDMVKRWANGSKNLIGWADMAIDRNSKFSKAAISSLESHLSEVSAVIAAFKTRALAAASDTNGAAPDADDVLDVEAVEDE